MSNSPALSPGVREAALVRFAPVGRFFIISDNITYHPISQLRHIVAP